MKVNYYLKSIHNDDNFLRGHIDGVLDYVLHSTEETKVTELRTYRGDKDKTIILIPNSVIAVINVEDD